MLLEVPTRRKQLATRLAGEPSRILNPPTMVCQRAIVLENLAVIIIEKERLVMKSPTHSITHVRLRVQIIAMEA